MKKRRQHADDGSPSKTRRKLESRSLQELGEALISLKTEDLDDLELPGRLRDAIEDAGRISSREALRRQRQYIGRLMRGVDPEPIQEFLARRQAVLKEDSRVFHAAESWRRRLLSGDREVIGDCAQTLGIDGADLARRVDSVAAAKSEGLRKGASRSLFRFLHEVLSGKSAGSEA